ncbi:TPA: hypothetical protein ACGPAZ_000484 [Streptococcus suis]
MIDRSYLPYQSAREYQDRGMQKWMGFFLSEHTSSLDEDKYKIEVSSQLSKSEILTYVTQLYTSQSQGMFVILRKGKRQAFQGRITELSSKEITIKTVEQYVLLQISEIIEMSLVEVLDEQENYI